MKGFGAWPLSEKIFSLGEAVEDALRASEAWTRIREIRAHNQLKVLRALQEARISEAGFGGSSGYGYNDLGRERLEQAFARAMDAEAALVRMQISTGTQAIALGLFGILRPGRTLLSVTGLPYDTLYSCIGLDAEGRSLAAGEGEGSLADFGVDFERVELLADGSPDTAGIAAALRRCGDRLGLIYIQRSRGYSARRALLEEDIRAICASVRALRPDVPIMVDNCYGEFTDCEEPCAWGADLLAGSLIKNPGGGLAPSGGYVCGRAELVAKAAARLSVPGLGAEVGASLGQNRILTQGLYFAPHVVGECLLGLSFTAALFEAMGISTAPSARERRGDIIQTIALGEAEALVAFCQGIQAASPVDAFVRPVPGLLPGYAHEVVMAAGAFVQGSSIELSADGPLTPPYTAYMQGGLNYEQIKLAALLAAQGLSEGRK